MKTLKIDYGSRGEIGVDDEDCCASLETEHVVRCATASMGFTGITKEFGTGH